MKKLSTTVLVLVATACSHFEEQRITAPVEQEEAETQLFTRSPIASAQNPYSLANVQEAYNDLAGELGLMPVTLAATHHYARFDIRDSIDYMIVHDSLGLELIEYPLDRDLTVDEMNAYMNDTSNTWYYTAVPANFTYPQEVDYEFLDYIYMQEEDGPLTRAGSAPLIDGSDYDRIIERSMLNNGIEVEPQTRSGAWYPSATIKFQEDYDRSTIDLEGVKVRCTNFINVGSGTTDSSGNVTGIRGWGGKFRNAVGYHIIWENSKWNIRNGKTGQAKTHGPKQREHWSITITNDHVKDSYFAAVHRALWAYFYGVHPLASGITKARMAKMNTAVLWDDYIPEVDGGVFQAHNRHWGGNIILIPGKNPDNELRLPRHRVSSAVFHELGHATHWQSAKDYGHDFNDASIKIIESWAEGVRIAYIRSLYPNYEYEYTASKEYYYAVVESMMNQGMTLKQIEDTIIGETDYSNWDNNVVASGHIPEAIVERIFSPSFDYTPMRVNMVKPISGKDTPSALVMETYRIPQTLPYTITFTGWTVTPASYTTTGGLNNPDLNITFTAATTYTLTANFDLPGSVTYSASKTVTADASVINTMTISGPDGSVLPNF